MVFKKGEPTAPGNYRPIGLNNTKAKLWTSMVTAVTASIAEHHNILSDAQEGFRQQRSTHRQLAHLLNDIEDAALTKQDLLVGYFDFSNASNMINHDTLPCTLSLNDNGKLGITTKALLTVQQTLIKARPDTPKTLTRYTSLSKKLLLLLQADIQLHLNDDIITPTQLPQEPVVPWRLLSPLFPLGITSYLDLITPAGAHLITTTDLTLRFRKTINQYQKVNHYQKASLNRLSLHLSQHPPPEDSPPNIPFNSSQPLSMAWSGSLMLLSMGESMGLGLPRTGGHEDRGKSSGGDGLHKSGPLDLSVWTPNNVRA
eukprot:gene4395-biopygen22112